MYDSQSVLDCSDVSSYDQIFVNYCDQIVIETLICSQFLINVEFDDDQIIVSKSLVDEDDCPFLIVAM